MKVNIKLVVLFSLTVLCAGLIGCESTNVESLGHGYVEVTYTYSSFSEPSGHRSALQYKEPDGKWLRGRWIVIWPDTRVSFVKSDVAVFVARKTAKQPDPDNDQATDERLFAVRAPELPLDMTDEVLWRLSKESPEKFQILRASNFFSVVEVENGLECHFSRDSDVHLDWNQISDIMREVKEKGVVRKDQVWHTSFIEKEFKPEVQK